jgi:hypothetical protein
VVSTVEVVVTVGAVKTEVLVKVVRTVFVTVCTAALEGAGTGLGAPMEKVIVVKLSEHTYSVTVDEA